MILSRRELWHSSRRAGLSLKEIYPTGGIARLDYRNDSKFTIGTVATEAGRRGVLTNGRTRTRTYTYNSYKRSRTDRIDRLLTAEHARDVAGALGLQFLKRFDRVERRVRRDDDVVSAKQR